MKKITGITLFFLEFSALCASALNYCIKIHGTDVTHWNFRRGHAPLELALLLPFVLILMISSWVIYKKLKPETFEKLVESCCFLPAAFILLFIPVNFFNVIACIFLISFTVYRLVNIMQWEIPECRSLAEGRFSKGAMLAILAGAIGAGYGIWMQFDAVYRLYLGYSDWSVYAEAYREIAGDFPHKLWRLCNVGGHFNVLPNIIGALFSCFCSGYFFVFIINSLVIYSCIPCTYFAARSYKLAPLHALLFSAALLLHFTPANLNLTLLYGYHPNVYLLPLFLLFTGFAAQKKYPAALICAAATLFVQETFAVLWFGYGLMMICEKNTKQRWYGSAVMAGSVLWFLLVTRVFMSWGNAENAANYQQMFHYSNLGNSIPEILLSPFQKPAVFFGELFAVENFYFTAMLLAGFWIACLPKFKMLIPALPPLAGVFMLNGNELANVIMQYQVEFFAVLIAAASAGLALRFYEKRSTFTGALAATIIAVILCGFFVGRLPYGYCSYRMIMSNYPRSERLISDIKRMLPPGSTVQAPLNLHAHMIGRHKWINLSGFEFSDLADYAILMDIDNFSNPKLLEQRLKFALSSKKWELSAANNVPGSRVFIFAKK